LSAPLFDELLGHLIQADWPVCSHRWLGMLGSERSIAGLLRSGERALIATQLGDLDVVPVLMSSGSLE